MLLGRNGVLRKSTRILLTTVLPGWNFITIHYLYFIVTTVICAIILWGSATPSRSVSFTDALFLSVSAMTEAGLNTVNLSTLNTFQQAVLFFEITIGSAIFVSAFVVQVRKAAFERKFKDIAAGQRSRGRSRSSRRSWSLRRRTSGREKCATASDHPANEQKGRSITNPVPSTGAGVDQASNQFSEHAIIDSDAASPVRGGAPGITFRDDTRFDQLQQRKRHHRVFSMQGVGARPEITLHPMSPTRSDVDTDETIVHQPARNKSEISRYFETIGGYISRNSEFHGLTDQERERLGGYEYRAVALLAWLVPVYLISWQLLGGIGCAAWVASVAPEPARLNGLAPWWVGAFNAFSAFNNSGMSLLDANMTAFQYGFYLQITMGLLILVGNTCYPIVLRLIVWTMWKIAARFEGEQWQERGRTLRFLLDHPRRCYTNLFPSQHTWWLLLAVITLNGIDWAGYEILNIGNPAIEKFDVGVRVINGLFQAIAVRSGGFYIVAISSVRISLQVLYVIMMYISVYPVVVTMRNSNVYEERSLGIYSDERDLETEHHSAQPMTASPSAESGFRSRARSFRDHISPSKQSNTLFVRHQLRAQLAHDAWTIALALFLIMIIEGSRFSEDPANFSVFNFLFEIVSGYGCVGISVGIPWESYSFCGTWHTLSKLILCVVMLRGRHRGLPIAIDRAILLPGEETEAAEEDDGRVRLARTLSRNRQQEGV